MVFCWNLNVKLDVCFRRCQDTGGGVLFHLTIEGCRWEPSLELARGCSAWNLEEEAGHRKRK